MIRIDAQHEIVVQKGLCPPSAEVQIEQRKNVAPIGPISVPRRPRSPRLIGAAPRYKGLNTSGVIRPTPVAKKQHASNGRNPCANGKIPRLVTDVFVTQQLGSGKLVFAVPRQTRPNFGVTQPAYDFT